MWLVFSLYEQQDFAAIVEHVGQAINSTVIMIPKPVLFGVRAAALLELGRSEEAIADYSTVCEMSSTPKFAKADALSDWALILLQQGEWNHAIDKLENALDLSSELEQTCPNCAHDYIDAIARASTREEAWKPVVDQLLAVYAKQNVLSLLGEGLVRSLGSLRRALFNEQGLRAWHRTWVTAGKPFEQLKIPLRIFSVGIEFLIKSDANVLLDLAKEERQILRDVLGLDVQK